VTLFAGPNSEAVVELADNEIYSKRVVPVFELRDHDSNLVLVHSYELVVEPEPDTRRTTHGTNANNQWELMDFIGRIEGGSQVVRRGPFCSRTTSCCTGTLAFPHPSNS